MSDETTPGPDLRARLDEALRGSAIEWWTRGPKIDVAVDAVLAVVQPELDRRDTEIARLRALWAAVAKTSRELKAEADGRRQHAEKLKAENERLREAREAAVRAWRVEHDALDKADAEIKRLKAAIGPVPLLDEPCGSREPANEQLACTLPARHDVHYATGSGTAWRCLCTPTDAEAAIARVRAVHPRESTGFRDVCGTCFDEREDSFAWPCPTIAALDRSDLPAVRGFAAGFDPREGST